MAAKEKNFNSLVSIIKIEPEEFQSRGKKLISNSDEVLRRKAKIFSDPDVFLERISFRSQAEISNQQRNNIERLLNEETFLRLRGKEIAGQKQREPHTCCLCRKVFSSKGALKRHCMSVHNKGTTMLCGLCPKSFRLKDQMAQHMKSHVNKAFACTNCDYKTVFKKNLEKHKKIHSKQEKCKICNKKVASLKDHLRTHQKEPCTICGKVISKTEIKKHMKIHDDKRYKCSDCSSTFSTKEALRRHKLEQHYEGKLHTCHCGSVFKTKKELNQHQGCHEEKTETCNVCQKKFKHFQSLRQHHKTQHSKNHGPMRILVIHIKSKALNFSGPFICDKCGSILKTRNSFLQHFQIEHNKNTRFFCDLCPKSFKYKYSLEDHMRSQHFKINPFTCKICGHKSTTVRNLKIHMLQHEPKKECKVCHKMVANMYDHMRAHVKVKCLICGKSISKIYLASHIKRVHASKKS